MALDLDVIRSAAAKDIAQVGDLRERFGLDIAVPAPFTQDDARLRATQAMLVSEAVYGTPREIVRREVDSVRSASVA